MVAENVETTPKDKPLGKINSRAKFQELFKRAKADVADMEEARARLR